MMTSRATRLSAKQVNLFSAKLSACGFSQFQKMGLLPQRNHQRLIMSMCHESGQRYVVEISMRRMRFAQCDRDISLEEARNLLAEKLGAKLYLTSHEARDAHRI